MGSSGALRLVSASSEGCWKGARYRTLMAAKISTTTGENAVVIRELSSTQALLTGKDLPATGVDVILIRRGIEVFATLSWSSGRTCGLEFENPLSDSEMATQLGAHVIAKSATALQTHRPAIMKSVVTADELATALGWSGVSPVEMLGLQRRIRL